MFPDKMRLPWWLRLVPKPLRYYLVLRRTLKLLERPDETARQIEAMAERVQRQALTLLRAPNDGAASGTITHKLTQEEPPDDVA